MKLATKKDNFILVKLMLVINILVFSTTGLAKKIIYISSDSESLNIKTHSVMFTGNVLLTQGNIKINTDKIVISFLNKKKGKEIIEGFGRPATFYGIQENGELIRGRAFKLHYELERNFLLLIGDAYLKRSNFAIHGDKILYLAKEKKIQAYSKKGEHVTTTIFLPLKSKKQQL